MKRNIIKASLLSLVFTTGIASAQVAISTSTAGSNPTPDTDAVLMLVGDKKQGFLLPTTDNIGNMPLKAGMVVYVTAGTGAGKVHYCDGSSWTVVGSGGASGSLTSGTTGLTVTNGTNVLAGSGTSISIQNATTSQPGLLTAADWTSFNSKLDPLGVILNGDLGGTYQAPVLSKIQTKSILFGTLAANDFLKYDGTNWVNAQIPASGFVNPMSSPNQMIIGGAAGAASVLNAPAVNQVLTSNGSSVPTWNSALNITGNIVTTGNINGANIVSSGSFSGNGSGITNMNAGNFSSGTLGITRGGTGSTSFAAFVVPRSDGTILTTSNLNSDGTNIGIGAVPTAANRLTVNTAGNVQGIYATNTSTGATSTGVRGDATGAATTNYGVYGSASGGTTNNWAGYFAGNAAITGNLSMTTQNSSLLFPAVGGAATPMMYMFATGTSNSDRFVIGHSPGFPNYGLEYQDSEDEFHFNFGAGRVMTFNPFGQFGINQENPVNSLDVNGNAVIGSSFSGNLGAPANGLAVQGNVGIGTANPGQTLEVFNGGAPGLRIKSTINNSGVLEFIENGTTFGTDALGFRVRYEGLADNFYISSAVNTTVVDHIIIDRGAGRVGIQRNPTTNSLEVEGNASKTTASGWAANSDRRIKTDIQDISNGLDLVKKLRPVRFKYTDEWKAAHPSIENKYYYNYIAQEYGKVFPDAVKGSGEYLKDDKDEILQIDTYDAQIVSIKAIQEQQAIIEKQQDQINTLTEELEKIKKAIGMEASAGKKKRNKK